jgi:radical SAM-linked protein
MPRLLFEKTGNAIWISHLDLMRLFQRSFKRAGLHLKHSQGFSPRPLVAIALPLSVGVESKCELLDFDLDGEHVPNDEIMERLNDALVEGVTVRQVYDNGAKIKHLAYLSCVVSLEYDAGIPQDAANQIQALFAQEQLIVTKKGKNGTVEQDIIPMIKKLEVVEADSNTLELHAQVCCQNPSLNPTQLSAAITAYLPELTPDFSKCCRVEIFDSEEKIFR